VSIPVHSCHIHIGRNAVAAKTRGMIGAMKQKSSFAAHAVPPQRLDSPCGSAPLRLCVETHLREKCVHYAYKMHPKRECDFVIPVTPTTYNFNALKCTDFPDSAAFSTVRNRTKPNDLQFLQITTVAPEALATTPLRIVRFSPASRLRTSRPWLPSVKRSCFPILPGFLVNIAAPNNPRPHSSNIRANGLGRFEAVWP